MGEIGEKGRYTAVVIGEGDIPNAGNKVIVATYHRLAIINETDGSSLLLPYSAKYLLKAQVVRNTLQYFYYFQNQVLTLFYGRKGKISFTA